MQNLQLLIYIDMKEGGGAPERIRTSDLPLRRGPRYPAVPPEQYFRRVNSNIAFGISLNKYNLVY